MADEGMVLRTPAMLDAPDPIMSIETAMKRLEILQQFINKYLKEDEDWGLIPGTPKKTLFKSGADKLCEVYGLTDEYEEIRSTIDFEIGLFDYELRCILRARDGRIVTVGMGCCSSYETKYRKRLKSRECPDCGRETIIKGKEQYGGGWVCYRKKGGCGSKFPEHDQRIVSQTVGLVDNPDIVDVKNTVLKMAKKRAKIDATLSATRSSGIFTQDEDDEPEETPAAAPQEQAKQEPQRPVATAEGVPYISEDERKKVHAAAAAVRLGHGDLKQHLQEVHGVDSTLKMTRAVADECLQWLEAIRRGESGS